MPLPSSALRDFSFEIDARRVDLARLSRLLGRLRVELAGELRGAEVYADGRTLELVLLLRFARTAAPSMVRRMQTVAGRLGATLRDAATLREGERQALYDRLDRFELRADVTEHDEAALATLRERLGIGGDRAPVLTFDVPDAAGLARLYLRNATRGLDAPSFGAGGGRPVRVRISIAGVPALELEGISSVENGAPRVRATPDAALDRRMILEASRWRTGRPSLAGEGPAHRACHLVARRPGLAPEPVIALGRTELQLLPERPIPEGAELRLTVESDLSGAPLLPSRLRVRASEPHALGAVQAQRLALLEAEEPERLDGALERLAGRPPRLLALLGDAPLRHALDERLRGTGVELSMPPPEELADALESALLRPDAVLLDLDSKETGAALPGLLDTYARAAGLRLVVLGQRPEPTLRELACVVDVVRKGEPLARLLRGIDRALGR